MELPELTLLARSDARLGCQGRGLGDLGQVVPLHAQSAVRDEVGQCRVDVLGVLRAVGAREVGEKNHRHGSIDVALRLRVISLVTHERLHDLQVARIRLAGGRRLGVLRHLSRRGRRGRRGRLARRRSGGELNAHPHACARKDRGDRRGDEEQGFVRVGGGVLGLLVRGLGVVAGHASSRVLVANGWAVKRCGIAVAMPHRKMDAR